MDETEATLKARDKQVKELQASAKEEEQFVGSNSNIIIIMIS